MSSTSRSVSQRHYYHRTECLPGPLSTSSPSLLVLKCHSVSAGILPVALDTVCLAKTQKGSNKWWLRVVHILWNQQSWAPTLGHHLMLSSTSCSRYSSCFVHTCIAWALCLCLKKFLPCQSHDPKNKPETHFPSFQWSQGAAIWSRLWESDALPRDFNEVESNRGKRTHALFYSVCCCAGGNRSLQLWGTSPKKKKRHPHASVVKLCYLYPVKVTEESSQSLPTLVRISKLLIILYLLSFIYIYENESMFFCYQLRISMN